MNILIVGGGGREHAVVKALKRNRKVEKIYALPGKGLLVRDRFSRVRERFALRRGNVVFFHEVFGIDLNF